MTKIPSESSVHKYLTRGARSRAVERAAVDNELFMYELMTTIEALRDMDEPVSHKALSFYRLRLRGHWASDMLAQFEG